MVSQLMRFSLVGSGGSVTIPVPAEPLTSPDVNARPRRYRRALLIVLSGALLAGCGGAGDDGESTEPAATPSELTGVIVDIRGQGRDVSSFTLQSGGEGYEIRIAADVDYGFDLSHLREHESSMLPVRCRFERRQGGLYALAIDDG